ncbi:MAG: hypothetical protein GKR89_17935 [Candidatus Latescibacteria bacterium]|nr:hypothetical protein [Candidatus Latescibacterota bacterium]
MQHRLNIEDPSLRTLVGLVLVGLLVGLFMGLPLGHELFHDLASEPETCPVHVLESSLLLLAVAFLALALLTGGGPTYRTTASSVPLPLFRCGTFRSPRAPPHS